MRDFENAAVLTDAVGLSIGRRVVGSPQVSPYRFLPYKTQSAETAFAIADDNLGNGWDVVAGGEFTSEAATLGNTPTSVVVTYTETDGQRVSGYAEYLKPSGASNGGSKVFHCSATEAQAAPSNGKYTSGFEKNLASQIGADFYRWNDLHYDITYAGIVPWEVTGFDDYVRWEVSVVGRGKRRKYVCQTRAVSMPPNFGFESLPIDPLGETSSSSGSSSSESSSSSSSRSSSSQSSSSQSSSSGSSGSSSGSSDSSGSGSSTASSSSVSSSSESSSSVSSSQSSASSSQSSEQSSTQSSQGSDASSGTSSDTSSGTSSTTSSSVSSGASSGSGTSSGTSSGSSDSGTSSGSGSGSSASSGCIQVVTDVQCSGGNLVVTKTNILATTC